MFHGFDNAGAHADRAAWMALLARAPQDELEAALGTRVPVAPHWLRPPETGLMMVQGRAGGTGQRFNLGEVTVTRCALRLDPRTVGVAYVLGRSHRHAELAALADGLLQQADQYAALDAALLAPLRARQAVREAARHADAQATRVEFFTVARESGAPDDEDAAQ